MTRAGRRCEQCRIPHHAVGCRDLDTGEFISAFDGFNDSDVTAAGKGIDFQSGKELQYKVARTFVEEMQENQSENDKRRWFVVVLTIAHVGTKDTMESRDRFLKALCQRCHLMLDAPQHKLNRKLTLDKKRGQTKLFEEA